jgi:hypothetical protein
MCQKREIVFLTLTGPREKFIGYSKKKKKVALTIKLRLTGLHLQIEKYFIINFFLILETDFLACNPLPISKYIISERHIITSARNLYSYIY